MDPQNGLTCIAGNSNIKIPYVNEHGLTPVKPAEKNENGIVEPQNDSTQMHV